MSKMKTVDAQTGNQTYAFNHRESKTAHALSQRYEKQRIKWQHARDKLILKIHIAAKVGSSRRLTRLAAKLKVIEQRLNWLKHLCPKAFRAATSKNERHLYVFSSAMLLESFRLCCETPDEGMHFIVGIEFEGVVVGTQMVSFPYRHRSIAGAAGEHLATHQICIAAHEGGQRVVAMIHSHPGHGSQANHRSPTDEKTQRLWEQTTDLVGAIWSRDGYLRWYSHRLSFEIRIVGTHLESIQNDQHLWKLGDEHLAADQEAPAIMEEPAPLLDLLYASYA